MFICGIFSLFSGNLLFWTPVMFIYGHFNSSAVYQISTLEPGANTFNVDYIMERTRCIQVMRTLCECFKIRRNTYSELFLNQGGRPTYMISYVLNHIVLILLNLNTFDIPGAWTFNEIPGLNSNCGYTWPLSCHLW